MSSTYSKEERAAILRKLDGSGMSLEEFGRWAGLSSRQLLSWMRAARAPEEATWVEVDLEWAEESIEEEALGC